MQPLDARGGGGGDNIREIILWLDIIHNFKILFFSPSQLEAHGHQEFYTFVRNGAPRVIQLDKSCLSILQPVNENSQAR